MNVFMINNKYNKDTTATSMTYVIDFEHILEYSVLIVEMYLRDMQCWVSKKLGKCNSIMHTPIAKHLLLCKFNLTLKYKIVINPLKASVTLSKINWLVSIWGQHWHLMG